MTTNDITPTAASLPTCDHVWGFLVVACESETGRLATNEKAKNESQIGEFGGDEKFKYCPRCGILLKLIRYPKQLDKGTVTEVDKYVDGAGRELGCSRYTAEPEGTEINPPQCTCDELLAFDNSPCRVHGVIGKEEYGNLKRTVASLSTYQESPLPTSTIVPRKGWRHSNGMLFCGTLRIARVDFDTDPAWDVQEIWLDTICNAMNRR